MLCGALNTVAAKPASRLPETVGTLAARVGLDRVKASYASADAKRFG